MFFLLRVCVLVVVVVGVVSCYCVRPNTTFITYDYTLDGKNLVI